MMPTSNQGVGMDTGFPDVCATPTPAGPVPIPYPAINQNAMGMPFPATIIVAGMPAHNMMTKSMMTNGDNAGVAHPSVMMPGSNTMGNPRILLAGAPAETLLNPMTANNMNCPLSVKSVPSVTNCLMGFAGSELRALVAELHDRPRPSRERRGQARPVVASLRGTTGRLIVRRCSFGAPRAAAEALSALVAGGARRIELDLRGNPGGDLRVAAALAGLFLEPGPVGGFGPLELAIAASEPCRLPLVVLVDEGTASAAEVLAAALLERGRATLAGRRTAGKTWGLEVALGPGEPRSVGRHALLGPRGALAGPLAP